MDQQTTGVTTCYMNVCPNLISSICVDSTGEQIIKIHLTTYKINIIVLVQFNLVKKRLGSRISNNTVRMYKVKTTDKNKRVK